MSTIFIDRSFCKVVQKPDPTTLVRSFVCLFVCFRIQTSSFSLVYRPFDENTECLHFIETDHDKQTNIGLLFHLLGLSQSQ